MRSTEIFCDDKWQDVTSRKAIVFGIGNMFVSWWNGIQLSDIAYLVDSDEGKQGLKIQIGNCIYEVFAPDILGNLSADSYYVILPGVRFIKERKDAVRNINPNGGRPYLCGSELRYVYDNLYEMMLCDQIIRQKIKEQNCSLELPAYIEKFNHVVKAELGNIKIEKYIPIKRGHKVIFEFDSNEEKYICSIRGQQCLNPADSCSWRILPDNIAGIIEIGKVKKKLELFRDINIYEDETGFLIQHCGNDNLDVSVNGFKKEVLKKIRRLHISGEKVSMQAEATKRFFYEVERITPKKRSSTLIDIGRLMAEIAEYLRKCKHDEVICHGDFHHGNIIEMKGELYFIDWDFMCMMNPLYDVCRFLYYASIDQYGTDSEQYAKDMADLYAGMADYLSAYYGRGAHADELKQAVAMMLVCEGVEMCLRIQRNQGGTDLCLDCVLEHIYRWEDMT